MSKKKIFASVGIVVIVLAGLGVLIFFRNQQTKSLVSPLSQPATPTETKPEKLLLYEDEAGFSFQYPETLGIVEKDVNDETVYSSLELSSKGKPGEKLVVKITDTALSNIDKWLEKNPQPGKLITTSEVSLSGMKGRIFKYDTKNLILVIDSGILYYLESPADRGFWDQAITVVSSSFQLTEGKTTSSVGSSVGGSVIEEGEEIIE